MPAIDVVIPTFDRPDSLLRCLRALADQSFRDFTAIVVDDASPIPVEDAIDADLRASLDLTVLRVEENGGPGRARNVGVRHGHAPMICFIDDDIVIAPDVLARHREAVARDERLVAIGSLIEPADANPAPWIRWEAAGLEEQYRAMVAGEFAPTWRQFYTGNAALSRKAFEAAGGFDQRLRRAEDIEFAWRLDRAGCQFRFDAAAHGLHYADRTLSAWLRIPRAYAQMHVAIDQLHPESDWLKIIDWEAGRRGRFLRRVARFAGLGDRLAAVAGRASQPLAGLAQGRIANELVSAAYALTYWSELDRTRRRGATVVQGPAIAATPLSAMA